MYDPDAWIPDWEDMTNEELVEEIRKNSELQAELFDMEAVASLIFKISYPKEVIPLEPSHPDKLKLLI